MPAHAVSIEGFLKTLKAHLPDVEAECNEEGMAIVVVGIVHGAGCRVSSGASGDEMTIVWRQKLSFWRGRGPSPRGRGTFPTRIRATK